MLLPHPQLVTISLPDWTSSLDLATHYRDYKDWMTLAIELARRNVVEQTGGPFASVIVEADDMGWRLVSIGVNRVVTENCSLLHGETMAIMFAQKSLGTFDLSGQNRVLLTTAEPCIQCFGAIWWAGVRALVTGANAEDVQRITGFNEGPLPEGWKGLLREHPTVPIDVMSYVLRKEACEVLEEYRDSGALIYNAGATASKAN